MSRYEAYPEYRDSGVATLGSVPVDWRLMQLKRSVDGCVNGIWGDEPREDGADVVVIRVADFDRAKLRINETGYTYRSVEESSRSSRRLKTGDLLLEKSGGGEKTLVGQVVRFDKDFEAVTSNFVAKMSPLDNFDGRYLNYVFLRYYASNLNEPSIKQNTGIQNLDSASYLSEKFAFPPVNQQQKIASFLDHVTAKIDTLIEKQQQLIKLLKEKRQAVISHAVTKGLNPDAPMKDSGVEWLGEVPAGWKVMKLGQAVFMQEGPGLRNWQFTDSGTKVICVTNITEQGIDFSRYKKFISNDEYESAYGHFQVQKGDVLLSSSGNSWGKVAIYKSSEVAILNTSTIRLNTTGNRRLEREYIPFLLKSESCREQLGLAMTGACQPNFGPTHLKEIKVAIPPKEEQRAIFKSLEIDSEGYLRSICACENAVTLLNERRTALISAAVTGKIDVRNWQPPESPSPSSMDA